MGLWMFIKKLWSQNWELKFVEKKPTIIFLAPNGKKVNSTTEIIIKPIGKPIYPNKRNPKGYKVQPNNRITIPPNCIGSIQTEDGYVPGPFQPVQIGDSSTISLLIIGTEGGDS